MALVGCQAPPARFWRLTWDRCQKRASGGGRRRRESQASPVQAPTGTIGSRERAAPSKRHCSRRLACGWSRCTKLLRLVRLSVPRRPSRNPVRSPALLRKARWEVNDKRVEWLWRREGLKVPVRQPKRAREWLNDGSCVRLRTEQMDHVWSYDFVHPRTHDGRAIRTLNVLDEFTRESLAIRVQRRFPRRMSSKS